MKKSLVMIALAAVSVAPVFAGTTVTTQPQPQQQQPAKKEEKPAPVEVKKIAGLTGDKDPTTKGLTGDKDQNAKKEMPATTTTKPKLMLIADEKPSCCPSGMDKKDMSGEKKDAQKTPAQTPAKTTAPKVALA